MCRFAKKNLIVRKNKLREINGFCYEIFVQRSTAQQIITIDTLRHLLCAKSLRGRAIRLKRLANALYRFGPDTSATPSRACRPGSSSVA